jgi:RNA polymerase sigma-70 factor, ECF subfamily
MKQGAGLREIEGVYRARAAEFRRVAAAIVGDRERALDVVQEAFAAAVGRRSTFRGDAPLEAWLWRIVVNLARNDLRERRPMPPSTEETTNGAVEPHDARLAVALLSLTERQRLVVFLRHYADLDYRTIAETLDVSEGTVGATLNTAHRALRTALEEVTK